MAGKSVETCNEADSKIGGVRAKHLQSVAPNLVCQLVFLEVDGFLGERPFGMLERFDQHGSIRTGCSMKVDGNIHVI